MQELLVADSFRVRMNPATGEAEVRGAGLHLARFLSSAQAAASEQPGGVLTREDTAAFLNEAISSVADYGEGWPRFELWLTDTGALRLSLQLRPLQALGKTVQLVSVGTLALQHPQRKGPNIARLATENRSVGGESVLTDGRGMVSEGATTSLVWWHDDSHGPARGGVSACTERVPSVTEALLARGPLSFAGEALHSESLAIEQLQNCEVWAVNALHGIRVAASLDSHPLREPNLPRLLRFQAQLDDQWEPLREAQLQDW